jgi:hypothetical protein
VRIIARLSIILSSVGAKYFVFGLLPLNNNIQYIGKRVPTNGLFWLNNIQYIFFGRPA